MKKDYLEYILNWKTVKEEQKFAPITKIRGMELYEGIGYGRIYIFKDINDDKSFIALPRVNILAFLVELDFALKAISDNSTAEVSSIYEYYLLRLEKQERQLKITEVYSECSILLSLDRFKKNLRLSMKEAFNDFLHFYPMLKDNPDYDQISRDFYFFDT